MLSQHTQSIEGLCGLATVLRGTIIRSVDASLVPRLPAILAQRKQARHRARLRLARNLGKARSRTRSCCATRPTTASCGGLRQDPGVERRYNLDRDLRPGARGRFRNMEAARLGARRRWMRPRRAENSTTTTFSKSTGEHAAVMGKIRSCTGAESVGASRPAGKLSGNTGPRRKAARNPTR